MPPTSDVFASLARLEGVPSALASARDSIDALLRDRGLRRTGPEATTQSLLRGARASAALEEGLEARGAQEQGAQEQGAQEQGAQEQGAQGGGGDAALEEGALRLSAEVLGLLPVWRRSPLQALARMHTLVARGLVADGDLGRPVRGGERLTALAQRVTAPTEAPALAVAAVVHIEIVSVQPFARASGVVARAAERLLLVDRGVDPASVTVPEAGHLDAAPAYAALVRRYRDGDEAAVRHWLMHCAEAYAKGAELSPVARPGE